MIFFIKGYIKISRCYFNLQSQGYIQEIYKNRKLPNFSELSQFYCTCWKRLGSGLQSKVDFGYAGIIYCVMLQAKVAAIIIYFENELNIFSFMLARKLL